MAARSVITGDNRAISRTRAASRHTGTFHEADALHKYEYGGRVGGLAALIAGVVEAGISLAQRKVQPTVSPSTR